MGQGLVLRGEGEQGSPRRLEVAELVHCGSSQPSSACGLMIYTMF